MDVLAALLIDRLMIIESARYVTSVWGLLSSMKLPLAS
jgi:hypothetical protein